MRDLQRLERLSSIAALGLWADDVVVALDRAASGPGLAERDARLLEDAAEMLEAVLERSEHPLAPPAGARSLAATNKALTIVATLARQQPDDDEHKILTTMATVLRDAARGEMSDDDAKRAELVMDLFGRLGEHQLVESNSIIASRRDPRPWTETRAISSFS